MDLITKNLHANRKTDVTTPSIFYNYNTDPQRDKERKQTLYLKKARQRKNSHHPVHHK